MLTRGSLRSTVNRKALTLDYDDLFSAFYPRDGIYHTCAAVSLVNGDSMGWFSLAELVKRAKPTSKGKYIAFQTLYDPEQMSGQRNRRLGGGNDYPTLRGCVLMKQFTPICLQWACTVNTSATKRSAHSSCGAMEVWL